MDSKQKGHFSEKFISILIVLLSFWLINIRKLFLIFKIIKNNIIISWLKLKGTLNFNDIIFTND